MSDELLVARDGPVVTLKALWFKDASESTVTFRTCAL
jgi:hypothetical protein